MQRYVRFADGHAAHTCQLLSDIVCSSIQSLQAPLALAPVCARFAHRLVLGNGAGWGTLLGRPPSFPCLSLAGAGATEYVACRSAQWQKQLQLNADSSQKVQSPLGQAESVLEPGGRQARIWLSEACSTAVLLLPL